MLPFQHPGRQAHSSSHNEDSSSIADDYSGGSDGGFDTVNRVIASEARQIGTKDFDGVDHQICGTEQRLLQSKAKWGV